MIGMDMNWHIYYQGMGMSALISEHISGFSFRSTKYPYQVIYKHLLEERRVPSSKTERHFTALWSGLTRSVLTLVPVGFLVKRYVRSVNYRSRSIHLLYIDDSKY